LTHREKPVTNFALSKCNLCHCAKAMVEWSATAVGIARQADTLAIIAADPEPKRNMKQIMLPALEVGEVRVNRSTYQVKPFYLSNRSTYQVKPLYLSSENRSTYQVKPFYLSNQTVLPFKFNL
jgi:hypothetical protein